MHIISLKSNHNTFFLQSFLEWFPYKVFVLIPKGPGDSPNSPNRQKML
jgi:hypothetical protein